jgi:hypothetical protein
MARAIAGPMVTDIRGKLATTVWQRGRTGLIARAYKKTPSPQTPAQQWFREAAHACVLAWANTLTQAQRDVWATAAKNTTLINSLGQKFTPTPLNLFTSRNINIIAWMNDPMLTDYPGDEPPPDLGPFTITATATPPQLMVYWSNPDVLTGTGILSLSNSISPGISYANWFIRAYPEGGTVFVFPNTDITYEFVRQLAPLAKKAPATACVFTPGKKIWVKIANVNDGTGVATPTRTAWTIVQ